MEISEVSFHRYGKKFAWCNVVIFVVYGQFNSMEKLFQFIGVGTGFYTDVAFPRSKKFSVLLSE